MVEIWRMGPTPLPMSEVGRFAATLEATGWDGLAVGENNKQPDPYAVLGLVSAATTTLRVGTATAVPTRHPMLMAVSMATIQGLSRGRARFSIGRGDSAVKALQQKPMSVADFETYLNRLQAYLRREEVEIEGTTSTIAGLAVVDPSLDIRKPFIDAAATGPRMIDLAVRCADSVSFAVGADPERVGRSIDLARQTASSVGRDLADLSIGCYVQVAVTDDDNAEEARARIRPLAMTFARFSAFEGKPLDDVGDADKVQIQRAAEALDAKFKSAGALTARAGGPPGELDFFRDNKAVDDEFIDRFAIIGSPEHCAARLQALVDLGVSRILIGTRFMGTDVQEENTARIGRDVLPRLRRPAPAAA
jgi:5,10-methylenetetrahydromethanopterin reductase